VDIDELIRAEFQAQADRAPDPLAVVAGAAGRARARRHRRVVVLATAAVLAAVTAVAIPQLALRGARDRAPVVAATSPHGSSVALDWQPGPPEKGMTEIRRFTGPDVVGGGWGVRYDGDSTQTAVTWQVGPDGLTPPAAENRVPVRVGDKDGFFDTSEPKSGQTMLWVRVEPDRWGLVLVADALTSDPRGLAVRVARSLHHGDAVLDPPVRFGPLPAGLHVSSWLSAAATGTPGATRADMVLETSAPATGPASDRPGAAGSKDAAGAAVNITVKHGRSSERAYPGDDNFGRAVRRTPVQVGDRTGYWVQYMSSSTGALALGLDGARGTGFTALEVPLPDGDTLQLAAQADPVPPLSSGRLRATVSDADLITVAEAATALPVDYSWLDR
jgi:hypothetical protein